MKKSSKEFLVGCLVLFSVALMLVFGWLMGVLGPFTSEVHYTLLFGFAGGVEVGSPVRVSGVKVGKVERIEFLPEVTEQKEDRVSLKVTISCSKTAAPSVREDSKFFVNMAGIIGERYIEISPGSPMAKMLPNRAMARGIDPPRIDQLLSQGYGVFGKIQDFLEDNEQVIGDFVKEFNALLQEANKLMKGKDKQKLLELIENMVAITRDVKGMSHKLNGPSAQEFLDKVLDIVRRAHQIDKETLHQFLQKDGIRAHIF